MHLSSWTSRLLVLLLIALPVAPILWDLVYPASYAKWLLADAANQYDSGNVEKAQRLLHRSYQLWPEISRDANFWQQLGRIELSPDSPATDNSTWMSIVRKIRDPAQRANAAVEVSTLMLERKMYGRALAVLKEFLPAIEMRSPLQNNLIAYTRALAKQDLDEAIEEIDLALKRLENESFLDTKAWVLHQKGQNDEALETIDRSIEMHTKKLRGNSAYEMVLQSMEKIQRGREQVLQTAKSPITSESQQPEDEANMPDDKANMPDDKAKKPDDKAKKPDDKEGVGWAHQKLLEEHPWLARGGLEYQIMATLRYHRLRILEALEQTSRAEEDSRWLEAFSPKPWDSLD